MKYEVDQSGRIEETYRPTIISIANKEYSYTVKINSKIKRLIQSKFQKMKKPKMFGVYGFASGVIILVRNSKIKNSVIIIDIEYDGYNKILKEIFIKYLDNSLEFRFENIGKKSPAHCSAYKTFKKLKKADYNIDLIKYEKIVLKMIRYKNKWGAVTPRSDYRGFATLSIDTKNITQNWPICQALEAKLFVMATVGTGFVSLS